MKATFHVSSLLDAFTMSDPVTLKRIWPVPYIPVGINASASELAPFDDAYLWLCMNCAKEWNMQELHLVVSVEQALSGAVEISIDEGSECSPIEDATCPECEHTVLRVRR